MQSAIERIAVQSSLKNKWIRKETTRGSPRRIPVHCAEYNSYIETPHT
ncbi:hypothetical protein JI435_418300 [Parastagonospora nodorum SN15]|uniref:Uncharacterized protein n=1 Tax=Phaeosphaeria nodorum (strain SN15 / ATCC MYA-4574 / FGSC 10173) TaxID=321614 RepID=A0A7U2FCC5_PHANO|nr:hypothetical protein JI435_418300 [Parastagonospora nodorum SN15]